MIEFCNACIPAVFAGVLVCGLAFYVAVKEERRHIEKLLELLKEAAHYADRCAKLEEEIERLKKNE